MYWITASSAISLDQHLEQTLNSNPTENIKVLNHGGVWLLRYFQRSRCLKCGDLLWRALTPRPIPQDGPFGSLSQTSILVGVVAQLPPPNKTRRTGFVGATSVTYCTRPLLQYYLIRKTGHGYLESAGLELRWIKPKGDAISCVTKQHHYHWQGSK